MVLLWLLAMVIMISNFTSLRQGSEDDDRSVSMH